MTSPKSALRNSRSTCVVNSSNVSQQTEYLQRFEKLGASAALEAARLRFPFASSFSPPPLPPILRFLSFIPLLLRIRNLFLRIHNLVLLPPGQRGDLSLLRAVRMP